MAATAPRPVPLAFLTGLALLAATALWAQNPPPARPAPETAADPAVADVTAEPEAEDAVPLDPDLFFMPRIAAETRIALLRLQQGDLAAATAGIDRLVQRYPALAPLLVNRAALAMLAGETELGAETLARAVALGLPERDAILADPLFAPLARDPRWADLPPPPAAREPVPAPVGNGQALVSTQNTTWNPATERLEPRFAFPDGPAAEVLPDAPRVGASDLLREHWRQGRAAGNHGDLYDNRDRGHSTLRPGAHPQLTHVTYSDAARAADVDYALNDSILFDRPTIGNSSTAHTRGAFWRSLPRLALTRADGTGPMRLWQNADNNQLYVHPAHRDYDDTRGDLMPANTPYLIVSRGSSGSDRPFLEALVMALAAFRPDTKARLTEERMIVPTLQMVFRRSLQHVRSREAYLSGAAHPAVFERPQINAARMVSLANSIEPGDIPAQVRLRMEEEDTGTEGVDFFGRGFTEQLFDTPGAIARIWRSREGRRSMVVSAAESRDVNGRPLAYEWRLLQGDPAKVRIEPLNGGQRARITLDWHEPFPISDENPLVSRRVDIGVFANNGVHDSAPAFVSVFFPSHESRSYAPDPDGTPRILSIDYAALPDAYADPLLLARADWRDVYAYSEDGTLRGWTRSRADRDREEFAADGARILSRRADGSPERGETVSYVLRQAPNGDLLVDELSTGEIVDYPP